MLSQEAVARSDAGFLGGVRLCLLTSRIGLNSAVTDDIDPAVEARHDRYDVDGIHVFQLPTISAPPMAPNSRFVKRDSPLHITRLPGAGSLARFR